MKRRVRQNIEHNKLTFYGVILVIITIAAAFMRYTIASHGLLLLTTLSTTPFLIIFIIARRELRISQIQGLFIILMLWCVLSLWSYRSISLVVIRIQLAGLILFFYLLNAREERLLILAMYLVATYFIYAYFFQFVYWGGGIRRYIELQPGVFLDPNVVGGSFIIPSAYSVYYLLEKKPLIRKIGVIAFEVLAVIVTLFGGSRSALLAMFAAGIGTLLLRIHSQKKKVYVIAIIAIGAICLVSIVQQIIPQDLLARFTMQSLEASGGSGRTELISRAMNHISTENSIVMLLFGYGFGSAVDIIGKGIHNTAIDMLWGLGIFGFSFYCYIHIRLIIWCIRSKSYIAIASIIAVLLWSMTLSLGNEVMYWVNIYCCMVFANNKTGSEEIAHADSSIVRLYR